MAIGEAAAAYGVFGGGTVQAIGQAQDREATELEGVIADLDRELRTIGNHIQDIKTRVIPPAPQDQGKTAPGQIVRTTYADKLGLLLQLASEIRVIAGQLNGRI